MVHNFDKKQKRKEELKKNGGRGVVSECVRTVGEIVGNWGEEKKLSSESNRWQDAHLLRKLRWVGRRHSDGGAFRWTWGASEQDL